MLVVATEKEAKNHVSSGDQSLLIKQDMHSTKTTKKTFTAVQNENRNSPNTVEKAACDRQMEIKNLLNCDENRPAGH